MSSIQDDLITIKSLTIGIEKRLRRGTDPHAEWRALQRRITRGVLMALKESKQPGSAAPALAAVARSLAGGFRIKAAVSPAMVSDPSWAGELSGEEVYMPALLLVSPSSALAQIATAATRVELINNGRSMNIPNSHVDADPPVVFFGEGQPIACRSGFLNSAPLSPFKSGLISVFTNELVARTAGAAFPVIERILETDIKRGIDKVALGSDAATPSQPAGLLHNAGIVTASAAVDPATAAAQDVGALVEQLTAPTAPERPFLLTSPARKATLQMLHPGLSIPIIGSEFIAADQMAMLDAAEVTVGGVVDSFNVDVISSGVVHESNVPLQLVDGSGIVASPQRELFQTNCSAVMLLEDISWLSLKPAALIEDVTW